MATSSFGKQFTVQQEKTADFVEEMAKEVTPTLRDDFQSCLANLPQDNGLKAVIGMPFGKIINNNWIV